MVAFGGIIDDAIVEVEDVGWSVELEAVGVDQAELELQEGFSKATELPVACGSADSLSCFRS